MSLAVGGLWSGVGPWSDQGGQKQTPGIVRASITYLYNQWGHTRLLSSDMGVRSFCMVASADFD